MLNTLTFHYYIQDMVKLSLQMRSSIISVIYRKAMRISNSARKNFTVGEITNYISVDAQRIVETVPFIHSLWSAPYMVVIAVYLLYQELGYSAFAGVVALVVLMPFNSILMKKTEKLQEAQLEAKDSRIKLVSEALTGMKVIKLYAWEMPFMGRISEIRNKEMKVLRSAANIWAFLNFAFACSPFIVTVAVFAVYVFSDPVNHVLTADKIFVCITLFNMIRIPMIMFPYALFEGIKLFVSINRINKFLNADDLDTAAVSESVDSPENAIEFKRASFAWGENSNNGDGSSDNEDGTRPVLKDIDVTVPKNSLVAVVGVVGSGKSSLLSAMLGEMHKVSGEVNVEGSVAYVPQQAWIQNLTVKDNILFSSTFSEHKYSRTVDACALKQDLEILPAGDRTEIGENGINLSGGQKQRISLARAVYSDSDIYLLDDPLSAVDAHVGKHIFEKVISSETGMLKDRTRVLVTHGIGFLDKVDQIWVVKDGALAEVGSYNELMAKRGAFSELLAAYQNEVRTEKVEEKRARRRKPSAAGIPFQRQLSLEAHGGSPRTPAHPRLSISSLHETERHFIDTIAATLAEEETDVTSSSETQPLVRSQSVTSGGDRDQAAANSGTNEGGQLIEEEEAAVGRVKLSVFGKYFKLFGFLRIAFCFSQYVMGQGTQIAANLWLSRWADANRNVTPGGTPQNNTYMYLEVYSAIGLASCAIEVVKELVLFIGTVYAAKIIHEKLLHNVFRSPMSFFDTNPTGRIINRFSSDIDTIDTTIPFQMTDFFYCMCETLGVVVVISSSTPLFLAVFVPIVILYGFIQQYYIATSRQLKRLESIRRSPIFSHFSESVTGVTTIRAYRHQDRFCSESEGKVANSVQCSYLSLSSNR